MRTKAARVEEGHVPVLVEETLDSLRLQAGGRYLDGTVGLGGHSAALMRRLAGQAQVCGLDRDGCALAAASLRLAEYGGSIRLFHMRYSCFAAALDALGWEHVDGALLDIGVSSLQIDEAGRGFSFYADGPLDMRMDADGPDIPAERLISRITAYELKKLIAEYGEDPQAGRIARAVVKARDRRPITTTRQLADVVEGAYPPSWRARARNHPATRTFQAIRMAVNNELVELEAFLDAIVARIRPGGRVAVISFHSVEDRVVKHRMRRWAAGCVCPPHTVPCRCRHKPEAKVITVKPIFPSAEEIARNPRAASARLRVAERLSGTDRAGHSDEA
jgi:16S rRNA (cytosine1402-N4)-methyltransferase